MNQILADKELAMQIEAAEGPLQMINDEGTVIALCTPIKFPHSPYSRKELEQRREEAHKHPELGKPLTEVLAELMKGHGEGS